MNTYKPPNLHVIIEEKKAEQNSVKPFPAVWEMIWTSPDKALSTHRMQTPMGWLVLYQDIVLKNSAMIFVPDTYHEWIVEKGY